MSPSPPRLLVVILLAAAGAATPAAAAPFTPPVDARERWIVGFAAFRGEDLAPDDAWLAWSVPLMLRDRLAGLAVHAIGPEEREAIGRAAIVRERRAVLASLATLRASRDAAELGETPAPTPSSPRPATTGHDALADAVDHLAWLDGLAPSSVAVPDTKPIAIKEGGEPGLLLAAPFGSPDEAAARNDVDLLVGGSVREASGYFLVEVWAWGAAAASMAFAWRDAATRGELYERVNEAGNGLAEVLLGRPWASLAVTPEPPSASVLVDGRPPGTGRSRFDDLEPGSHELRVSAPGYRDEVRSVELAARTETVLAIALEPLEAGLIAVASEPPGADAWLDAIWQGRTPLDIPRPGERARLVVSLPDGPEAALTVGPSSPPAISISLSEAAGRSDEEQKAARNRFYGSFGWFVLSLPVPFYAYSWALDWAAEALRLDGEGDTTGSNRARGFSYGFYAAYLTGLGASITLAVWTVSTIVRYVRAADRSTAAGVRP